MSRPRVSPTLVAETDAAADRRTAYPLTIASRGLVSASTATFMRPVRPVTVAGCLRYLVDDEAVAS